MNRGFNGGFGHVAPQARPDEQRHQVPRRPDRLPWWLWNTDTKACCWRTLAPISVDPRRQYCHDGHDLCRRDRIKPLWLSCDSTGSGAATRRISGLGYGRSRRTAPPLVTSDAGRVGETPGSDPLSPYFRRSATFSRTPAPATPMVRADDESV